MADDVVIIPLGDRFLALSQDQLQEALAKGQEILGKSRIETGSSPPTPSLIKSCELVP